MPTVRGEAEARAMLRPTLTDIPHIEARRLPDDMVTMVATTLADDIAQRRADGTPEQQ